MFTVSSLVTLLVGVLVLALVFWLVTSVWPLPRPFDVIVKVLCVLVLVGLILQTFGVFTFVR